MSNRTNIIYYINLLRLYIGRLIVSHKKAWLGGQVLLEYAIIAVLVVSAIIGIQLYLQRALQGRYKGATDYAVGVISAAQGLDAPLQYDPYYHTSDFTTERDSEIESSYLTGGSSITEIRRDEQSGTGERITTPYTEELVE